MKTKSFVRILLLVFPLLLASCGGGGGGSSAASSQVDALAGTWFGSAEDGVGTMHQLKIVVDASGKITQILQDGLDLGLTGTVTKSPAAAGVFTFILSDTTEGGFIADASGNHMGFLDDSFFFGVLQKGATALPTYAAGDIAGTWAGYGVMLNGTFDVTQTFASSAIIAGNATRTFTGSDVNGAFSGSFPTAALGRWIGNFTQGSASGDVRAFLSADKTFAATWACSGAQLFPVDCSFSAWNKQ